MDLQQEKKNGSKRILATWVKLALLAFVVLALVVLPYRFDSKLGTLGYSIAIADSDGDGDSDGDSDGDGDGDGDDDGDDDDGDDDEDGEDDDDDGEDDDDDGEDNDDDGENDDDSSSLGQGDDDSDSRYKGSNSIGGIKGLAPVSSDEEAGLVGDWGDSSN